MSLSYLSAQGMDQVFNQFTNVDPNLQAYGYGQLYDQNGEPKVKQKYPGMWVQPTQTTVDEYIVTRQYQILIYDLVYDNDNGDNQNAVISDCEEFAFRLIRFLKNADEVFNVTTQPIVSPFTDKFFDNVSGVIVNVDVEFNGVSSECTDPDYIFDIIKNNIQN
jgi:hypothetical protein